MRINLREILREKYPWLVAEWNGIQWEAERMIVRRRLNALEQHLINIEDRYALLENLLNEHSNGQKHRIPKPKLPIPDQEN